MFPIECLSIYAQEKWDNIWVLGYLENDSVGGYGGTMLNFSLGSPHVAYFPLGLDAASNGTAQICDSTGNFLFFSNGCEISNYAGQIIENGDQINPGYLHDQWCNTIGVDSYKTRQGQIALPWPNRPGEYALFHLGWYQNPDWPYNRYIRDFYYTHLDMNSNDSLGKVLEKNVLLLQNNNLVDNLTAVRHGNGRDWWLIEPCGLTDSFFLFLLSPSGIEGPFIEQTAVHSNAIGYTAGQVVFSPDGSKYVRANYLDGVDIFDFDRCQGKFLSSERLPYPGDIGTVSVGASISPSSRFLYVSTLNKLFQYDFFSNDIILSKTLVGQYDGFVDTMTSNLPVSFYQHLLAPNGNIYISVPNTTFYFHVIHQPDMPGVSCDFRQHDLNLATRHGFCVPNFPFLHLYDAPGSLCDTLGISTTQTCCTPLKGELNKIYVFPNPTNTEKVNVLIPLSTNGRLKMINTSGQIIKDLNVSDKEEVILDCSLISNGIYILIFLSQELGIVITTKLVVNR